MKILIVNGPNLNLLGKREPDIYGNDSFETYLTSLRQRYPEIEISYYQSIVLNAGAYTHTSVALHDCIRSITSPVVEVHISNVHKREEFRRLSMISPACIGVICGFGMDSYRLAIEAIKEHGQ